MAQIDKTYHNLLEGILTGYKYRTENRPDVEMTQITSATFEHDMLEFPAMTTKKLYWKGVVAELIWFLRGDDNIKFLVDNGVNIWNKDAYNYYLQLVDDKHKTYLYEDWLKLIKNRDISNLGFEGIGSPYAEGPVGRNYGVQWRDWTKVGPDNDGEPVLQGGIDQIKRLIVNLRRDNPINRRHIVTAWNPAELEETALPPCHWAFEVLPRPLSYQQKMKHSGGDMEYLDALWNASFMKNDKEAEETLNKELLHVPDYGFTLKWHQRSVDTFLGLPFNIASYGLLSKIIGVLSGLVPLSIIGDLSNVHIYGNHTDAVRKQLSNNPAAFQAPDFKFSDRFIEDCKKFDTNEISLNELFSGMEIDDFQLVDYKSFGKISAEMVAPKQ